MSKMDRTSPAGLTSAEAVVEIGKWISNKIHVND